MATTQVDIALAKLVVQNGLSDQEQVDSLLQFQDMSDRSFGEVLVECGIVSQDQLGMLLAEARRSVQADATRVAPVRPATPSPPFGVGSPMSMSAQGGGGPAPLPLGGSRPASTPPQPARPPPAAPAAPAPRAATGAGPAVAA
ncbi:MAG: hypothetical protein HY904_13655, partial [Deltaproteobacteria bacterium]|nr:hypothetical protein [Deltaproteobacteria bacterium]